MGGCATKYCFTMCLGDYYEYLIFKSSQVDDSPSCFPCAATGLYMLLPSVHNDDALRGDAERLYRSMKGLGTRDADLARIFVSRTPEQIQKIKQIFDAEFGGGDNLEQWVRDDTSGDWERALGFNLRHPAERDAQLIHDAITTMSTSDKELRELMTTRSNAHIQRIQAEYQKKYGHGIAADIKADANPNLKRIITALQARADYLAQQIHDSIKGKDSDDIRIIRILCSAPRSNAALRRIVTEYEDHLNIGWLSDLEYEVSMPDLQDIKEAYQRLYQKSLVQDIANDTTGNYRRTLLTLLQAPEETDADSLNSALEGKGVDDALLTEVMVGRSNRALIEAAQVYQKKYGRPLRDALTADTAGDYQKMLLALLTPRDEYEAECIKEAAAGMGADDTRLMSLIFNKPRYEMLRIVRAFERLYNKPMEECFGHERRYWYKRFLLFAVRQSTEKLVWVSEPQLRRLRDI